jgi:ATP-dependent protease Clp ATPase subunit
MPGIIEKANIHPTHKCSFCGINNLEAVGVMVSGPGVCICQDCIYICVELVFSAASAKEGK